MFTYICLQFQIFRETKESELQNLLKARRDLESKLFKVAGHGILDDTESTSKVDASLGNLLVLNCNILHTGLDLILRTTSSSALLQIDARLEAQGQRIDFWPLTSPDGPSTTHEVVCYTWDIKWLN